MVGRIIKVCLLPEELSDVQCNVQCPVEGCSSIMPHYGSLRIHLQKVHRITEVTKSSLDQDPDTIIHFHCPVKKCVYNEFSERHFASKKLLKQHYAKMHAEKKYKCAKCSQGFGLERDCRHHQASCGVVYHCATCHCPFSTVEATLNHCRRKQHQVPDSCLSQRKLKTKIRTNKESFRSVGGAAINQQNIIILNVVPQQLTYRQQPLSPLRPLLPKPVISPSALLTSENMVAPKVLPAVTIRSTEAQTIGIARDDNCSGSWTRPRRKSAGSERQASKDHYKRRGSFVNPYSNDVDAGIENSGVSHVQVSSTAMQTSVSVPVKKKAYRSMVGTQTVGDYILTTAMTSAQIPVKRISQGSQVTPRNKVRLPRCCSRRSSETQTADPKSPRRKRRRRSSTRLEDLEAAFQEQNESQVTAPLIVTSCGLIDNETQTTTKRIPTMSTQTQIDWSKEKTANQQSTETQTNASVLQKTLVEDSSFDNVSLMYKTQESNDSATLMMTSVMSEKSYTNSNVLSEVAHSKNISIITPTHREKYADSEMTDHVNYESQLPSLMSKTYESSNTSNHATESIITNSNSDGSDISLLPSLSDFSMYMDTSSENQQQCDQILLESSFSDKIAYRGSNSSGCQGCLPLTLSPSHDQAYQNSYSSQTSLLTSTVENKKDYLYYSGSVTTSSSSSLLSLTLKTKMNHEMRKPDNSTLHSSSSENEVSGNFIAEDGIKDPDILSLQCQNNTQNIQLLNTNSSVLTPTCEMFINNASSSISDSPSTFVATISKMEKKNNSNIINNGVIRHLSTSNSQFSGTKSLCDPLMPNGSPYNCLVTDSEVQTLDLGSNFDSLLNGSEDAVIAAPSATDTYTQTVGDMMDLFGNNIQTQTSDDDPLLHCLEFSDIETQTGADLDCVPGQASMETQTPSLSLAHDVECSDMETQTGFGMLDLDTILTDSHTQTTFDELENFLSGLSS